MCHKLSQGFALVTAIFLLVVLSALGAYLLSIASIQHTSASLDVMGARAYQAARAGIEWGAFQVLQNSGGTFATNCAAGPTSVDMTFAPAALTGLTTTVTCSASALQESGNTVTMYQIISTACSIPTAGACPNANPGSGDYVERQLQATVGQ